MLPQLLSAGPLLQQGAAAARVLPALWQQSFRWHKGHHHGPHEHGLADQFDDILKTAPAKFQGEARQRLRVSTIGPMLQVFPPSPFC